MKTEQFSPRYGDLETWAPGEILNAFLEGQMAAVAAVQPALPALEAAALAAVERLKLGGRLGYAGAGTSGRLGAQDGAELPPTFGWPPERLVLIVAGGEGSPTRPVEAAEDDREAGRQAVIDHAVGPDDVMVGLAASGTTPFTRAVVEEARARGALTIGIANNRGAPLLDAAEHGILIETGPEAIAGSTRMKAGTAQKIALNLFSSLVMVRLGHVYKGLMVDMKASNEKLRRRAEAMLIGITGRPLGDVRAALAATGGRVKPAVLVLEGGATAEEADELLRRCGGHLRDALDTRA